MENGRKFDVAVIGGGPGGYVAAIRAAQLGKKVALIERGTLGGTCLNRGCIPTKTLLAGGLVLQKVRAAEEFGIQVKEVHFDFKKMEKRKDDVVAQIVKSLTGLIRTNGITVIRGEAKLISSSEIKVIGEEGGFIQGDKIIIATGSEPMDIPAFPCDHKKILNSTSMLEIETLPKTLVIIGGGYIGCEFASLYRELGVNVIILEALPSLVSAQGKHISEALSRSFKEKGIDVRLGVFVESIQEQGEGLEVKLKGLSSVVCDLALVSVGRKLNSASVGLEAAGVQLTEKGAIKVNEKMETNVPGIYAIGDVTGIAMLAHVASHQGLVAAENACGKEAKIHYEAIPAVIYTYPEIASVGLTLEQAEAMGYEVILGKFPFQALAKSLAMRETEGFAQIIVDKKTKKILGAQVVGSEASVLIAEMTMAIENELTLECLTSTIHAHPTLSEAWLEAGYSAESKPVHFPPKIRK